LILTLTINPAIDRTITVDRLAFEDRTYITASAESAGGRGINAARVISSFGGETCAIATSGGRSGERFQELLGCCSFPRVTIPIRSEIRTNLTITDRHGLTVKLNETGPSLDAGDLERIEAVASEHLSGATWLMICGSVPPGVPPDFYARLIEMARGRGVQTLLDTDGEALRLGIEAGPALVAPNQREAERLLNRALLTRTQYLEAAQRMRGMGAASVILSLGSRGAVGAFDGELVEALPPRIEALCPIGAGDALAAAFVWAAGRNEPFAEALRWGVAAGTASAALPGVRFASLAETREMCGKVEVRPAE
jgi:1-phosphofructokinase family hexose kinase